jgi:sensor histidine kinase regulating citrate/malate metabolism
MKIINNGALMKIELTLNEINTILGALGAQPYTQVFQLVTKIQQQAQEQLKTEEKSDE